MEMRDDIDQDRTASHAIDVEALDTTLEAFRDDPTDAALYEQLRDALMQQERHRDLAEIGELWASHEPDARRRAAVLSTVGEAWLRAERPAFAERALHRTLELEPANELVATLLFELHCNADRHALAADVIEDELEELRRVDREASDAGRTPRHIARRAERHRVLARLWDEKLGRVDQALNHWQQAWHLEPEKFEALEAARAIYASLGDDKMVARLYEAELEGLGEHGSVERRAAIQLELGRVAIKQGDPRAAAEHFEASLALDPDSLAARKSLAEIYASSDLAGDSEAPAVSSAAPGIRQRAATLFVELGEQRLAEADEESGIGFLRRALTVDPGSQLAVEALERALHATERLEELDQLYRRSFQRSDDPRDRAEILHKRAALYHDQLNDRSALKEIYIALAAQSPAHGEVSHKLRELYRDDEDWAALASHIEAELPAIHDDRARTRDELLELATIVREHLGERDRSAELLHKILLEIDPQSEEALARYGDHFRERRDWRGLADLLDFASDNARDAGAAPSELVRQLEEVAQIVELKLGDIDRAISTWQRIQDLEPESPKPKESIRRLMSRAKMWESLVGVLEQEAQAAQAPEQRADALRRIAQVYRERQVNPHRAIALYEEVVQLVPEDRGGLKALSELYDRDGDDTGLAYTLRRTLDLNAQAMAADGQFSSPREWPVAKRAERLTSLRRMVTMYEQLGDLEGVVFACSAIIEMLPGDRDALDRMARALEKAGDLERLEQTLDYHVRSASGPAERAKVLRRLARIAVLQGDDNKAVERWEAVLVAAPNDGNALDNLADLYERRGSHEQLADVLERRLIPHRSRGTQTGLRRGPGGSLASAVTGLTERTRTRTQRNTGATRTVSQAIPDLATRVEQLKRYARVVDDQIDDTERAIRAWQHVIDLAPRDRDALDALARLYEAQGEWQALAEILALRAERYREDMDDKGAAAIVLERAYLLEDRLGAATDAITALEGLLDELDPANIDAHQTLRRLYEAHGEFESAVRVAEREMYLAVEPEEKIDRGLEIGLLCRDRLGDPARALQAFERVLALQDDHEEALTAAADLYARIEDWPDHIRMLERRVGLVEEGRERREIMTRIAEVYAERLSDHDQAFAWYRQAHEHAPDASSMAQLRRAAEAYGLWQELADVYDGERARLTGDDDRPHDVAAYVAACRELAAIAEHRLSDPKRAMNVLFDAITVFPRDTYLLAEAERIAKQSDDKALWHLLLECVEAAMEGADRASRVSLHQRRAHILEERLDDNEGAVEELLKAFAWAPERGDTRKALYELAERCGAWNDVIAIESALIDRALSIKARIATLGRKASILEEKLDDKVRAFRTQLVAFLLVPEHADTIAHLWRLARAIGDYRDGDRTPRPEPPPAYVHPPEPSRQPKPPLPLSPAGPGAGPGARRLPLSNIEIRESRPSRRDPTMDLSLRDVRALRVKTADFSDEDSDENRTMQLDILDLEVIEGEGDERRGGELGDPDATHDTIFATPDAPVAPSASSSRSAASSGGLFDEPDHAPASPDQPGGGRSASFQRPPDDFKSPDPTIELNTEDLMVTLGNREAQGREAGQSSPPPFLPGVSRRPPETPVRRSRSQRKSVPPPVPRPEPLPPIPRMLVREYESPWEEFATAYEMLPASDRSAQAPGRSRLAPPTTKLRWLFRVAEIWETGAGNVGRAFNTLARALDLSSGADAEVRARLYRLAAEHNSWDRLAELYDTAAEEADTAERAIGLLLDVAAVRVEQGRPRDTETILRRVLGMRPDHAVARQRLENFYRSENRWIDLAASLEERTDPRLGTAAPDSERTELLRELVEIYRGKLGRAHDAIDSLLRLRDLLPEDIGVLRDLAELYSQVGRWSKVIEMLNRVNEIADGTADAKEALRRIAGIYEKELELPDRAIVAYSQLIAAWPDDTEAHAALDTLYEEHARWKELAEILRRRAALTRDPANRARLLRRRADVLLNRLDSAEDAAAALRHARSLTPHAPGLADELVQALIAANREREAAAVLEIRITRRLEGGDITQRLEIPSKLLEESQLDDDSARANTIDDTALDDGDDSTGGVVIGERTITDGTSIEQSLGDTAALMIRLAQLKAEKLGDPAGAKAILERALELIPDHPTALAALARLFEAQEDPRTYAEARLREADALDDIDAKVEALLKAGFALRDRCKDIEAARVAFERVLEVRPYHSDATWALAGLVEQSGAPEQAAQVLEKRLDDETLDAEEKARIMTQLAALARHAEIDAAAEQYLIEALDAAPGHLPAIMSRADLLAELERYDDLAAFLLDVLPQVEEAPTAIQAELRRRLAMAYEQLDRDDDAYQVLLDADRLHRGHLLVKLALGENRYRARRWREAALHLGALAMHVDARNNPAEVAQGLYHAALAEIRSLRPEKAKPLYERAIDLKPNFAPGLHALAEIAMEEGDHEKAADLLTRQAVATDEPAERMRLFEALGDLAVDTLSDEERARVCYEAAVNAASPLESKHLPLLDKLLARQTAANDHRGAARTAELMATFGTDNQAQAAQYTAAAEHYLAIGDLERGVQAAGRAVEADPYDLMAVTVLSEQLMSQGEYEGAAAVLGRALGGSDSDDDEYLRPRKSQLWYRLAQARKTRGDLQGATAAWEKSLDLAPDSDGAMGSRRELLQAWKDDPEKREKLLEFRRVLAADTMARADVVNYARALCKAKHDDGGRAILEVARVLGHEFDKFDNAYLERRPMYDQAPDEAYRGSLSDDQRVELLFDRDEDDDGEDLLAVLFRTLWDEAASLLWPDSVEALERRGIAGASRVPATTSGLAVSMFPCIASALDVPATVLYATADGDAPDVQVVCVSAPIVVIGPRMQPPEEQGGETPFSHSALRFLLGRIAELARPEHIAVAGLPHADLVNLLASLLRSFAPERLRSAIPGEIQDEDVQRAQDEVLHSTLPVKLRARIEEILADASSRDLDLERYRATMELAADRTGLLMCGDIQTAIACAQAGSGRDLIRTTLRPGYLDARAALGVGVR